MGAAAAAPAAGVSILGTLASGIMSGVGTNAADQFQSQVLSEKAQLGQTAATETNANMVTKLNSTLGNIDAVRAASHDDPSSPTGAQVRNTAYGYSNTQRVIQTGNILEQSEMDQSSANYLQSAGQFALLQGILGGAAGAAKIAGGTNTSSFGITIPGSFVG